MTMRLMKKYQIENKYVDKALKWIWKKAINYQAFVKMIIVVYMFLYLSSLLTTVQLNLKNGHEVASFSIGSIFFLLSILFIFLIFSVIQ